FFDRLADRAYQPVNIQHFGRNLVLDLPIWAERLLHCRSITMEETIQSIISFCHYICVHLRPSMLQTAFF
ncbi:MAG: hypothetical protein WBJ54_08155, partial [Syntrophorhabdus sp.]